MTQTTRLNDAPVYRTPQWWQIRMLESQGCRADDWSRVSFEEGTDFTRFSDVSFGLDVSVGLGAEIRRVRGGITNCRVGRDATVINVASVTFHPEAPCGVGTLVAALDETGSRPVVIYPGLSAQAATLMARVPSWFEHNIRSGLQDFLDRRAVAHEIGDRAVVRDCGPLLNASIGADCTVIGATALTDGAVVSNTSVRPYTYVGPGVNAENFIIEDSRIASGAILRNVYTGQGVILAKGFTAHDSLFFANCQFENGEACALLAGPYSVSMHKGSLMIGCQTAFMNAGSATNQSNHMYKLGPVHWGVMERGVKTASGSYVMLGAKIGAFSLVMGQHKTHPDSSDFPFSYLFGDERGATVVVPGAMLRSCGMLRDEKKWPARDRRAKRKLVLNDRIIFNVLNPYTVDAMLRALDTIGKLLLQPSYDDLYMRHKGMKFSRAALERAKMLYTFAIFKYLSTALPDGRFPASDGKPAGTWVDVGAQIMLRRDLDLALAAESIPAAEEVFTRAFEHYDADQTAWISRRFGKEWRDRQDQIKWGAAEFDRLIEDDRHEYLEALARETQMLAL